METTVEIPDELLQRAALQAAREGLTLQTFIVRALEKYLRDPETPSTEKPWEALRGSVIACDIEPEESPWGGYDAPSPLDPILESESAERIRSLRGSLKGSKAMDVFMSERKKAREL